MSTHKFATIASATVLLSTVALWPSNITAQNPRGGGEHSNPLPQPEEAVIGKAMDLAARDGFFRAANPESRVSTWKGSNTVYGRAFAGGATADEAAENFRTQTLPLFGINPDDFRLGADFLPAGTHSVPMMLDEQTGQPKFYAIFYTQEREGVPVYASRVNVLVRNEPGYPVVLAETNMRDIGAFEAPKHLVDEPNMATALIGAKRMLQQATFGNGRSVIWAGYEEQTSTAKAAVEFIGMGFDQQTGMPDHRRFIADAATGAILYSETMIHNVDVSGNVSANVTPGSAADICNPVTVVANLPYLKVNSGATTVFTNAVGAYTLPNAGVDPISVTASLTGLYFDLRTCGGTQIPSPQGAPCSTASMTLTQNVNPPGPGNFIFNDPDVAGLAGQFPRAEVNVYLQANVVRDYLLTYHPTFPSIAGEMGATAFDVNVNLGQTCNAFYSSATQSINFYESGGACSNTANSTVAHHEYGHRIVNAAGSGQSSYGEGYSDCMAVLISDDPCLGKGFSSTSSTPPCSPNVADCNGCLRTAANTAQYSTTTCSSCSTGAGHACGMLISGCVWSLRNNLLVTNPLTYRQILSDLTIHSVLLHGNVTTITPAITVHFLTLDDDDANILNGTPHYPEINGAFSAHNMPGPELVLGLHTTPATNAAFSGLAGGPFTPANAIYSIENVEDFPIDYTITSAQNWVDVSPNSGQIPANTTIQATVALTGNATSLTNGVYNSLLTFTNLTNGDGNTTRNVALEIGRLIYPGTSMPIPDNVATGASNVINVPEAYCVADVDVQVNIGHLSIGQLRVELVSPQGVVVRLHNQTGGTADNIVKTYDDNTVPVDGPGLLANFNGLVATGAWKLNCYDLTTGTSGTLNSWSLRVIPGPATCPPSAFAQSLEVPVIVPSNVTLTGTTATANPLTYVINSLPANASLIDPNGGIIGSVPYTLLSGGNVVRFKPDPAFAGATVFSYLVNDNQNSLPANISVQVGGKETVHLVNMNTNPGWSGTVANEWGFGQPTGGGAAGQTDPTSGFTGTNVYGYNLAGHYPNNLTPTRWLTSTPFDMTGATQVELRFRRWLGIESATFDHAYIEYSTNGSTWTQIYNHTAGTFSEQSWTLQTYQMPLADNQTTVFVRWGMGVTDGSVTRQGWNIDDVEVRGVRPPCIADTANNDRIVNIDDLVAVITLWGPIGGYTRSDCSPPGGNGVVDIDDLVVVITNWGVCP